MTQREFSKKIHGKNIKVIPATHWDGDEDSWGFRGLCPWCVTGYQATGYKTPKQAAIGYWDVIENHYRARHKGTKP